MKLQYNDFTVRQCNPSCLNEILEIQEEALAEVSSVDILRENTSRMLEECLNPPHYTIGAWYKDELSAFSVLFFPHDIEEDLSVYIKSFDITGLKTANNKLCIVRKAFRGNSLQYYLALALEEHAKEAGVNLLCATVSPNNKYSINNVLRLGYIYDSTIQKYGYERHLYYKQIN